MNCPYCGEPAEGSLRRCKKCKEPFYFLGKLLKYEPILSIPTSVLVAILPWFLAFAEASWRQLATEQANAAKEAEIAVRQELATKERATDWALQALSGHLSAQSKDAVIQDLNLPSRATVQDLEMQVRSKPESVDMQKKLYLYRALKR
jgi:hypothetical protein